MVPEGLQYTAEHEWIASAGDDDVVRVGITDFAQEALGDIVFVEFPAIGAKVKAGDAIGVVESVKAASDIYAPVSGEVIAINEALADSPEQVNSDPYGSWFFRLQPSDTAELDKLLDAAGYQTACDADA